MTEKTTSTKTTTLVRDTSVTDAQTVDSMHIDPAIARLETPLESPKEGTESYDDAGPGIVHRK